MHHCLVLTAIKNRDFRLSKNEAYLSVALLILSQFFAEESVVLTGQSFIVALYPSDEQTSCYIILIENPIILDIVGFSKSVVGQQFVNGDAVRQIQRCDLATILTRNDALVQRNVDKFYCLRLDNIGRKGVFGRNISRDRHLQHKKRKCHNQCKHFSLHDKAPLFIILM